MSKKSYAYQADLKRGCGCWGMNIDEDGVPRLCMCTPRKDCFTCEDHAHLEDDAKSLWCDKHIETAEAVSQKTLELLQEKLSDFEIQFLKSVFKQHLFDFETKRETQELKRGDFCVYFEARQEV